MILRALISSYGRPYKVMKASCSVVFDRKRLSTDDNHGVCAHILAVNDLVELADGVRPLRCVFLQRTP